MIKVENVSFRYDDEQDENRYALRGIDLEVADGEFVCIIGQNGSGKSTLAKLMNAIYLPTEGRVFVEGMDTADDDKLQDIRMTAGMVFQNPDNQMVASVIEEDVAFGAENLGVEPAEIRRRVDEALKAVDMYDQRMRSPEQLSGGQKQRVAIAGILAMSPKCIIFDESTAMLDPSGRREVMEVIQKLNSQGMTVMLITHHMDEAVLADRVFVMEDGRIVMSGKPRDIFAEPAELKRLGLDIPFAVEASIELARHGSDIGICLTPGELADKLDGCVKSGECGQGKAGKGRATTGVSEHPENAADADVDADADANAADAAAVDADADADAADSKPVFYGDGSEAKIKIQNVSHIYGAGTENAVRALDDVNLEIKSGEIIGIIGHTGSGKSTLVQHINGLLKPAEGKIVVSGLDITAGSGDGQNYGGSNDKDGDISEKRSKRRKKRAKPRKLTKAEQAERRKNVLKIRRLVGLVFQYPEYQLFEETVAKDIAFGPKNLGLSETEIDTRVRHSMDLVGLSYDEYAHRSPFELSGGEKRRVAVAGVLAMEPEVLILDEPTAGLDPQGRDELLDEIRAIHRARGTTIMVISHSMDDMASFAERIVVMKDGGIAADGTAREIFARNEFLASVGLDIPEVSKTLRLLKSRGFKVDETIISEEEGIAEILSLVGAAQGGSPC